MVWIWAATFLITLVVEIVTVELASIWFAIGSFVSFILALFGVGKTIQIIVFLVVSVAMFVGFRPICKKLFKDKDEKTNVDSVVGTTHVLESAISGETPGEVKVNGVSWRAVSKSGEDIEKGEKVVIVEVQGNKFIVEKENKK